MPLSVWSPVAENRVPANFIKWICEEAQKMLVSVRVAYTGLRVAGLSYPKKHIDFCRTRNVGKVAAVLAHKKRKRFKRELRIICPHDTRS